MTDTPQPSIDTVEPSEWLGRIGIGTWTWRPAAGVVTWDDASHEIYGLDQESFNGTFDGFIALVHPDDRREVLRVISAVAETGGDYSIRHRVVTPSGAVRWVEGQGRIETVDGVPVDGRGIVYLLSERMTLDRERDELTESESLARADSAASRERLRFLIELTDAISGSLNIERVARHFVSIITKSLASLCIVDLQLQDPPGHLLTCIGRDGTRELVATGHTLDYGAAAARLKMPIDSRRPLPADILEMDSTEQTEFVSTDGLSQYASAFPLVAHGTRVGTVLAIRTDRAWTTDSRDLLEASCRRVAGAFDRAELHADRSKFVAMFQAAATPRDLPAVPGLDIAVHYRPATDLVRLGGDLWDVFNIDENTWMVAVGDICGKGIVAAGHAELSRTALRSAAFATQDPAAALGVLNRTLLAESSRPMLTVALARLTISTTAIEVDLATAGHPAPIVVEGLDTWNTVETSGTMLGVRHDASFKGASLTLARGQSLALYTDGITDSRFGATFFGTDRLGETIARAWPSSASSLVSDVAATLDTWSAGQPSDDVVLLLVRAGDK